MKNQPIYGDIAILVENLNVHFFTYFTSIKGIIHKIETIAKISVLVTAFWIKLQIVVKEVKAVPLKLSTDLAM